MRKHMKRILGYLLAIIIFFSDIPIVVNADEDVPTDSSSAETVTEMPENEIQETESTPEEAHIISELTEKRDEKTKYFAMSDGTIKACIYPQNVHYLEEGQYEEIDNTLVESHENDKVYYKNKKNSFTVKMPEVFSDDYIEFSDENGYVKFKLLGATNKKLEKQNKENTSKNKDFTDVENINVRAAFKSVKGDIDIEYDLTGNKLKETIVLYKKTKNSFVFDVQTSATKAEVNTDNSISFFDEEGKELYMIASPYMTDAVGDYSNEIITTLQKSETGYTLTYTPDYEWLAAKERDYPVKIDPTLFQAIYKETVTDTYVSNVQTSSNPDIRGYWDVLNIGKRTSTVDGQQLTKRALIRFEIPSEIGKNDCIVEAKLDLVHYTVSAAVSVNGIQIDAHELTSGFTESGTWWGNQPTYDSIITDYALVNTSNTFSGSTLSYDSYNLTRLVNKWHNGATNYGILLKLHDETTTVSSSQQVYYFAKQSTYYGSVSKFVEITYRNAVGLEDYWSYTTQDFGQYGTGYVNNYNGNLVYVHEDASFNSLINGFTLSHVYNKNLTTHSYLVNDTCGYYGTGWRLNLVQTLAPVTVTGNSSVKYVYTDGDGTKHYFVQISDGSIVDEDGLGFTYEDIDEGDLTRKIKDKNGNILKFDRWGYLRHLIDSNNNVIYLTYSPIAYVDNYLTSITTSSGGVFTLDYDSNYNLTSITDNAGRKTTYHYNSNNLVEIHYPDNTILKLVYCDPVAGVSNSPHWLHDIIAPDGKKLRYGNYPYNGKIYVSRFTDAEENSSAYTYYYYSQNQTRILDYRDINTYYQFDTYGRPTCIYDDNQNIYSQTYTSTLTSGNGIFQNNKLATACNEVVYTNNLLLNGVFSDDMNNWDIDSNNSNAEFTLESNVGLHTLKSVKITNTEKTTEIITQIPTINSGNTYTLSGYIKTDNVQSENQGTALSITTHGTNGYKYYYSDYITGTSDSEINNGFQQLSVTISLEEGESITRVAAGLFNASGTVYIDCLQLEEGDASNQINLITNSSFEINSTDGTVSYGFVSNFSDGRCITTTLDKRQGNQSCKIEASSEQTPYVRQYVNINGKAGEFYSYGGWAKANSAPKYNVMNPFNIVFHFIYADGTTEWFSDKMFNPYVSDWQYIQGTVMAKKDFQSIGIFCCYYYNANIVYFDNLFLYRDTMQSYTYDENGNIISTSDYASQNETFQYNGNNHLAKLISPTGSGYEYLYNSSNNLISARSSEGIAYDVKYDENGNVISTSTQKHNYSSSLEDGKTYFIRLKNSGKYLAVEGSGTANYTNVIQETFTGASNQKWTLDQTNDGYYCLHPSYLPSMSLDLVGGASSSDGNIEIYSNSLSDAQKFHIKPQSDYTYQIETKCTSGNVVTVFFSFTQDNVTIMSKSGENNADQEWYFEEVNQQPVSINDYGIYQFRARHSGKYIEVSNSATNAGSTFQQYEQNFGDNQRFIVQKYENTEYYTISPVHASEMLLDVTVGNGYWGYPYIRLSNSEASERRLFKFEYNESLQSFYIVPKCDNSLALTIAENSYDNGGSLIVCEKSGTTNQLFAAEKFAETITSSATYQDNGNYPHTVTDVRGNTTTYTYDTSRGLQTGITDAKGTTTTYTYNVLNDRLESVTSGNSTVNYEYETNGSLKKITTPSGSIYNFLYDVFGRTSSISIGSQTLSETVYKDNYTSLVSRLNYGNGTYKTYTYDNQDRLISESINGTEIRTYVYDKSGNIAKISDLTTNTTTTFRYDLIGRPIGLTATNGQKISLVYDKYNRLSLSNWTKDDTPLSSNYIYGDNSVSGQKTGLIYGVKLNGTQQVGYEYDELTRMQRRLLYTTTPYITEYTYLEGAGVNTTTTLVKSIKNGNDTLTYTYDEVGNITSVSKNATIIEEYTYDAQNQLTSATYGGNTYTYSYDNGGNITEIKKNDVVIKTYTYGNSEWKDQLTGFNSETITYDEIGNPLTYRGGMTFTWQNGRQLASVSKEGIAAIYTYDADGLRTSKTVNGTTTEYYWLNGTLYGQKTGDESIFYLYDETGSAYGFILQNGTEKSHYYYEFNLQGDIIGIIDSTGTKVVEYTYGAWGDIVSITGTLADTIGQKNPLRYRGYYYDEETGFYYLSSRYYDAVVGRFLNADGYASTGQGLLGNNMFAYCGNNPINRKDPSGQGWIVAMIVAVVCAMTLTGSSIKPLPYKTADDAAKAFAESVYDSSQYIKHEYGTEIYSKTINGATTYDYNKPRAGKPHSVNIGASTPLGTKFVAYAHTHPNSNVFSQTDKSVANKLKVNAYVVGPNLELQRYDYLTEIQYNLGLITPDLLTQSEKNALVSKFRIPWDTHITEGCKFDCSNMEWPTN